MNKKFCDICNNEIKVPIKNFIIRKENKAVQIELAILGSQLQIKGDKEAWYHTLDCCIPCFKSVIVHGIATGVFD